MYRCVTWYAVFTRIKYATTPRKSWTRYPPRYSNGWAEFWSEPMKLLVDKLNHAHWLRIKAYSLISYRGHSENVQSLNLLHLFVALSKVTHFPTGIRLISFPYKMRAIFCNLFLYFIHLYVCFSQHIKVIFVSYQHILCRTVYKQHVWIHQYFRCWRVKCTAKFKVSFTVIIWLSGNCCSYTYSKLSLSGFSCSSWHW